MFGNSKYILFDVAVVISLVLMGGIALTAKRGVGVGAGHSSRRARTTKTQLEQQQQPQHRDMSDADSDSSNSPSLRPLRRQRHQQQQQEEEQEEECQNNNSQPDEHDESESSEAPTPSTQPSNNNNINSNSNSPLRRGSIVELYGSNSYFATPAWIEKQEGAASTSSATGSGYHAYTYTLHNAITSGSIPHVDSKFIHPYQIYKEGTRASCNIGLNELYLTPCVIQSHVITEEGTLVYRVSYLNQQRQQQDDDMNEDGGEEEENLVHDSLSFTKVQRKVQRNYMRGEQRTSIVVDSYR